MEGEIIVVEGISKNFRAPRGKGKDAQFEVLSDVKIGRASCRERV